MKRVSLLLWCCGCAVLLCCAEVRSAEKEAAVAVPPAEERIAKGITANRLIELLKGMGVKPEKKNVKDDEFVVLRFGDMTAVMYFFGKKADGDEYRQLQLHAAFGSKDKSNTLQIVNDWNRKKRQSRAYVDLEGDPCLEADLDLTGGVTEATIERFVTTFQTSLIVFVATSLSAE